MSAPTGDEPRDILYFGNDWFAENRTSSHQIALRLARRHRLIYVECPGLRAPKTSGRDLKKLFRKLARCLRGARQVEEGLTVVTLFQVPLHRFRVVRWLNRWLMVTALRWLLRRRGVRRPISWFMVPHAAPAAGRLGEALTVYYCIDDYAALPDVNVEAVTAMDAALTERADVVFVASDTLLEAKREINPSTHVSPHGVDLEHFARAQDARLAPPADVTRLAKPVVGFFGLIERWIDLELVDYLAAERPDWSFLLIGRLAVPEHLAPRRANIHYVGKRPYDELPAYGRAFDAAIIPYRLTRQVLHANPIKLREYLAMGKPVVSVRTPEIEKFADVVAIADTREEFLAKLDEALARPTSQEEIRRRMDRVADGGWDARLREVWRTIEEHLPSTPRSVESKRSGSAAPPEYAESGSDRA